MSKKGLTEIIFILDESGSMGSVQHDTIGGFNTFIKDQRELEGEVKYTFVKFSDYYKMIHDGVDIKEIPDLDHKTYTPHFSTALFDAVGKTINILTARLETTPEEEKPEKVIFAVLTDGEENASREFTSEAVINMVTEVKETDKWEFIFLGADIDAWTGGNSIGIRNTVGINKSDLNRSIKGLSLYTASYRSDDTANMNLSVFDYSVQELDQKMEDAKSKKK